MQALKDVIEGGSPTVAWSVVQAALSEQEDQLQRRDIAARGDAAEAGSSPPPLLEVKPRLQPQQGYPRVVLDSASLWRQFYSVTNEMIVTKAGRRMFPVLKLHVSQLEPTAMYAIVLEFRCTNQHRWRFLNGNWQKGSSCEDNADLRHVFVHFASVAPGSQWMQEPASFAKLKLSNRENGASKIKLNSLHKYQPYIHLIKIASDSSQQPLEITTFTFPETQFIAVTAYQNDKVTQMKIKNNPFAKAFLGGNASERAHSCTYIPPLEMSHGLVARLHPTLLHSPPPHLAAPSPPPPYTSPFPGPPPLQSFLPHPQQQMGGLQGGNYSLAPQIEQQMSPPMMPHDQFVYQDYNGPCIEASGPIEVYDEGSMVISCYHPQSSYSSYDNTVYYTTASYSPDYLTKPLAIFSHDDEAGHTPLPTTPSTASTTSHSPPACEEQHCFYQPFHQTS